MKIAMLTNTYLPHVGGVAKSVHTLAVSLSEMGHEVCIVAPEFPDSTDDEHTHMQVIRVPAWQEFNGSDFSVRLPIPFFLSKKIKVFDPDLIHTHHPFLLGDTAVRLASRHGVPLVFTHHTLYERYTHYVSRHSEVMQELAVSLPTQFAALCQAIIAPSESIRDLLRERGVETRIEVIPTGIDAAEFRRSTGKKLRRKFGLTRDQPLVGHVGRLAEEKNLSYLMDAMILVLQQRKDAHVILVGDGPERADMEQKVAKEQLHERVHFMGMLQGIDLIEAYRAMDLFLFTSKSETQGLVIAEAMTAGVPVIALDASGVREVVEDGSNGLLLDSDLPETKFAEKVLAWLNGAAPPNCSKKARKTAIRFERMHCVQRCLDLYENVIADFAAKHEADEEGDWNAFLSRMEVEWKLVQEKAEALTLAITRSNDKNTQT